MLPTPYPQKHLPPEAAARDDAMSDPLWQSLEAVKAGKVHEVSDPAWNTAGGILAANLMLTDIAEIYGLD